MSTIFQEIDVLDPRHLTDCSVAEYIERTRPDMVVMLINPSAMSVGKYWDWGTAQIIEYEDKQEEQFYEDVVVPTKDDKSNHISIDVESGFQYQLNFDDVAFKEGTSDGCVISLYNKTTKKVLSSVVFDIEYCRATNGFEWKFDTEDCGTDELQLLFYSGIPDEAADIGMVYQNVSLIAFLS